LLNEQDGLAAPGALLDVMGGEIRNIGRVDEVGLNGSVDVEELDLDRVQTLGLSLGW